MSQLVVSAKPQELFRYFNTVSQLDNDLMSRACNLANKLQCFEASCTEARFRVSVSHLADELRGYIYERKSIDVWVRNVGNNFLMADSVQHLAPGYGVLDTTLGPVYSELYGDLGITGLEYAPSLVTTYDVASTPEWHERIEVSWGKRLGREHKIWPERRGRPRNAKKEVELRIAAWEDSEWKEESTGHTYLGGVRLGGKTEVETLRREAGIGANFSKGKYLVGVYGGITAFSAGASGVIGDTELGLAAGAEVKAGQADALVGLKDGTLGAKAGVTLASVEGTVGMNISGWNVGLTGEAGLKFEIGLELGKKTRVYLGPFAVGLNISEALGS